MKVQRLLAAGFIALTTTELGQAADFSQVSLRPYVLLSSHLTITNLFDPDELTHQEQQQFITHGGATFSSRTIQVEQQIPSTDVYRGIATSSQLQDLRDKLHRANIRTQRSCEVKGAGSQEGHFDITWNSPRGNRNTFRVVYTFTGGSGLPPCRGTLIQLLAALRAFELQVLQNPDTELLLTPD
jgi:hypothetical protein